MGARTVRHLARLGIAGAMVIVLTGCPEDAADIVEYKATILNFDVAPMGDALLVTGDVSIDGLVLADFDPTRDPDAFARATSDLGFGHSGTRYLIDEAARNSGQDSRLPSLGGLGTEAVNTASACRFGDGDFWGGSNGWDFYCFLQDLRASQDYTVMLVRYALTVNGDLDSEEMLLTGAITNPDELTVLGGTAGGYPTELCDFDPARPTYTIGVTGDQNPLVMGYVTSNASGNATFDCLIGTGGFWKAGGGGLVDPDSAPFAPNTISSFDLPRYNYVVIVEGTGTAGAPVPTGDHVLRFQVGADIDASGNPIDNGLAPTPAAAADTADLIAAPGGAGRPDSLGVEIFNAEPLGGGNVWQAWLVNRDESPITVAPATAAYQRVAIVRERDPVTGEIISETDSILETVAATTTFTGQFTDVVDAVEQEVKHRLVITDATVGGGSGPGFFTDVLLTQESGTATTPSSSTVVWFHYTDQNGTPTNFFDDSFAGGTLLFGHFVLDDPASSETFTAADWLGSRGLGGVRENEVTVEITNLPLPPIGYYYEGWLVGPDGSAVSLGPIKGLAPDTVSLFDADIDQDLPSVTATGIRFASVSAVLEGGAIVSEEGGEYVVNLSSFYLTLEPKLGFGGAVKNIADLEVGSLPIETIIDRMRNP